MYEEGWRRGGINALSYAFTDYFTDPAANAAAAEFTRRKIRQLVRNPATAELLSPRQHIGTKRTCVDTGYFETYNRDNVELIDARATPITEITASGCPHNGGRVRGGRDRVRDRLRCDHRWADEHRHPRLGRRDTGRPLGRGPADLPRPEQPRLPQPVHGDRSRQSVGAEQHGRVDRAARRLDHGPDRGAHPADRSSGWRRRRLPSEAWGDHVQAVAATTLYPVANSWYMGANIPGKPRVFMPYVGGCGPYRKQCDEIAAHGYEGFVLGPGSDQGRPRATVSA